MGTRHKPQTKIVAGLIYSDVRLVEVGISYVVMECNCGTTETIPKNTFVGRRNNRRYCGCNTCMNKYAKRQYNAPHSINRIRVGRRFGQAQITEIDDTPEQRVDYVATLTCECGKQFTRTLKSLSQAVRNNTTTLCRCAPRTVVPTGKKRDDPYPTPTELRCRLAVHKIKFGI